MRALLTVWLRLARPDDRVPAAIRAGFARASLTAATLWASVALYLSVVPSYAGVLLHSHNRALLGAVATGAGHGLGILHAQDELNALAPPDRRGEVTAAFICCIYLAVGGTVIAAGLFSLGISLQAAVSAVALVLAATALATAAWQAAPALARR